MNKNLFCTHFLCNRLGYKICALTNPNLDSAIRFFKSFGATAGEYIIVDDEIVYTF